MKKVIVKGAQDIINALINNKILYSTKNDTKYYVYKNLILSSDGTNITLHPPIDLNEEYVYYE